MLRLVGTPVEISEQAAREAARELSVSPLIVQLLYARGARDVEAMRAFLHPDLSQLADPFLLPDMNRAITRLQSALDRRERIAVYGDYDVDGVCASAMLTLYLSSLGADVFWHIPCRHTEGYGMNEDAVRALAGQGAQLVITVDNGIAAQKEIALCGELGMQVIVTDHHQCQGQPPRCEAVVCHTRPDCAYPGVPLCGAATVWKLIQAHGGRAAALPYLPLAGLATVADVMPLVGENRVLVWKTLECLNAGEAPLGLMTLARCVHAADRPFRSRDLAFELAPRINAAGRMASAALAMELLCTGEQQRARNIAQELNDWNQRRQAEEAQMLSEARTLLEAKPPKRCIVLYQPGWNPGIVGIAASRLAEEYSMPTLLFGGEGEEIRGSGRSVPGLNLFEALGHVQAHLLRYGGHAAAAGMSARAEQLDELRRALDEHLLGCEDELFLPLCRYEIKADFSMLTPTLIGQLQLLAPFGEGNPEPVFLSPEVSLKDVRRMGGEGAHLKAMAAQKDRYAELVAFYRGEQQQAYARMAGCDLLYRPEINRWRGEERLQLNLVALRPSLPRDDSAYIRSLADEFYDAILQDLLYNKRDASLPLEEPEPGEMEPLLREDLTGSLILCFTTGGALAALKRLRERNLLPRADLAVGEPMGRRGQNLVLLAPRLERLVPGRYQRILAYDLPGEACKALWALEPRRLYHGPVERESPLHGFGRDALKACYRAMAALGRHPLREDALLYAMEQAGQPRLFAKAALKVFLELGFLGREGEAYRMAANPAARNLTESSAFCAYAKAGNSNNRKGGEPDGSPA